MHKIYLAATMNYGLGSNDPEELAYYNKIKKEMDDMKKEPVKKGALAPPVPLTLRFLAGLSLISAPLSSRTQSINTLNILSSRITVFGFTFINLSSRHTAKCLICRSLSGISPSQLAAVTLRGYFSFSALRCISKGPFI